MKKSFILTASVLALALMSCKKDRVCECTDSSNEPGYTSTTNSYTLLEVSKGTAKKACITWEDTYTSGGSTYTNKYECKLK
jgi:hypothetical protein